MQTLKAAVLAILATGALLAPGALAADPTVDELVAKSLKAVGGADAVKSVKTLHAVFETEVGGQKLVNDTSWSRDGGRLAKMTMPGMGEMILGTDGKVAWRKIPPGYSLLEGKDVRQLDSQANMYRLILEPDRLVKDDAESVKVEGAEPFAGKDCYRLHYVSKDKQEGDVFFDASSGLLVGSRQVSQTPRGPQTSTMTLSDWQETAGVKFFRTIDVQRDGGPGRGPMTLKAITLEVNSVPADAFALPEEVKKLAAGGTPSAPAPDSAGGAEIKLTELPADQQAKATQIIDGVKKTGNSQAVKQSIASFEQAGGAAPESQKKMYQYVVQELKKVEKSLGR